HPCHRKGACPSGRGASLRFRCPRRAAGVTLAPTYTAVRPMDFPWFEFLGLMLAFGINAVIPGADFAMVLRQSVVHGRREALLTSAGIATAILVHGTYTLLGVGVIVGQ